MKSTIGAVTRTLWASLRAMIVLTLLLGVAYPLVVWGIGQLALPGQANGSRLTDQSGQVVGSTLIGQSFCDGAGQPLAQYFQPRPSVAGDGCGYDATDSKGSNHGPEEPDLVTTITERRAQVAAFNRVDPSEVPVDAVTASGSGLDPDISQAYALIQIDRVAKARSLTAEQVRAVVDQVTSGPDLGYIGQTRVNVVRLNLALDELPT